MPPPHHHHTKKTLRAPVWGFGDIRKVTFYVYNICLEKCNVIRYRSVVSDSDPYSDPVTRYRTCGLSEKEQNLSNTQICIGEYP